MATPNYALPTPPDNTLVSEFPKELRESNTIIDGVLKSQGDTVALAQQNAEDARQAAIDAAGLVGTPADSAIAAAVGATNSDTRHNLSKALDVDKNPALGKLWANMVRCQFAPVSTVFLGSSSTAAPNDDPVDRWPNQITVMMQQRFASGPGAETATGSVSNTVQIIPGVHGYNLGISGATTNTYLPQTHLDRIALIQPSVVFHAIGSNDAKLNYAASLVKSNISAAIASIDALLTVPATHVLIHMHQRDDADITTKWDEYREELRALSIDDPTHIAFIDISRDFASIGIPGPDPYTFRKTDRVHLEPAGLQMTGKLISNRLGIATEQRQKPVIVLDTFGGRADDALGMADTGQRWLQTDGFRIIAGKGAATIAGGGTPVVETGTPDQDISVIMQIPDDDGLAGIVFRTIDRDNRYSLLVAGGTVNRVSMFSHRAGVQVNRWNVNYNFPPGTYTLRVTVKGVEMQTFINGNLVYTYRLNAVDEAVLGRATFAGLRAGAANPARTWDWFRVRES